MDEDDSVKEYPWIWMKEDHKRKATIVSFFLVLKPVLVK